VLVVLVTGGFVIDAGPFHLSVRNWIRPLVIAAAAAWLLHRRTGRTAAVQLWDQVWPFLERRSAALALVVAAAAAADGIAWGTYAAAGADAAGYISQADLFAAGRLAVQASSLTQQVDWPEPPVVFSPHGYRAGAIPGEIVPTYPPGLPLVMAFARLVAGPDAVFLVVPLLAAVGVFSAFALGRRLHSGAAGLAAAALLATSPILLYQVAQPMSDVAATGWWALAMALASRGTSGSAAAAGAAAGLAFLTRPVLVPLLAPVALALWLGGGRLTPLLALGAAAAPFGAGLAFLQRRLYGTAIGSGHGSFDYLFDRANIAENFRRYTDRFLTGETAVLVLLAIALAVLILVRRQGTESARSPRKAVVLGAMSLVVVLLCYLPYGIFDEWSYFRFLLPALPAVFVGAGALIAAACLRLPSPLRGIALLTAMTLACSFNANEARRQGAFAFLRFSEARYQITGRYLEAMLPPNAVVIAGQESAAVHHYAGRPIVRWDIMYVDPDKVVSDLTALGRHPVFVLELEEERDIKIRFPQSSLARLDWPPVADIGDHVHVRVFDPSWRASAAPFHKVDRVHAP
jgi:hypothetical protein